MPSSLGSLSLPHHVEVSSTKSPEDRDVPDVDDEEAKATGDKEGGGDEAVVEGGLVVHPGHDGHAHQEGGQVDLRVLLELFRAAGQARDQVQDPGLVEDGVNFGDKTEDSEPNGLASEEGAGEAQDDKDVVDKQHAGLLLPQHVQGLGAVNAYGEGDQAGGAGGGGEHEVGPHGGGGVEGKEGPGPGEPGAHPGHVGALPLPGLELGGEGGGGGRGQEEQAREEVGGQADQEPEEGGGGGEGGQGHGPEQEEASVPVHGVHGGGGGAGDDHVELEAGGELMASLPPPRLL